MLLILFNLSVRLRELNFEVKVYENYKQEEVLDKIGEGSYSEVRLIAIKHIPHVTSRSLSFWTPYNYSIMKYAPLSVLYRTSRA